MNFILFKDFELKIRTYRTSHELGCKNNSISWILRVQNPTLAQLVSLFVFTRQIWGPEIILRNCPGSPDLNGQAAYHHRRTVDISLNHLFSRQLFYFPIRKRKNAVRPRNAPRKAPITKTFSLQCFQNFVKFEIRKFQRWVSDKCMFRDSTVDSSTLKFLKSWEVCHMVSGVVQFLYYIEWPISDGDIA